MFRGERRDVERHRLAQYTSEHSADHGLPADGRSGRERAAALHSLRLQRLADRRRAFLRRALERVRRLDKILTHIASVVPGGLDGGLSTGKAYRRTPHDQCGESQ